jgi:hypothetical protein
MNKGYIQVGVFVVMAAVYALEIFRRRRARRRNQQGLCVRCLVELKANSASTIQNYQTIQPQYYFCPPCAKVMKLRERVFMASFIGSAVILLAATFYFLNA